MKANSERVVGKNFRDFCGRPLFRWTLETLLSLEWLDYIVINTDAGALLAAHGLVESDRVIIRERKTELCGDDVSMNLIIADDIRAVDADTYLMTHVTNPLLAADTITRAMDVFESGQRDGTADSLFSVNKFQTRFYRVDGSPVNHDPKNLIPTQEIESWYEENSNLYFFTRQSFSETSARIGQRPILFESPALESIDIDTPQDWQLAVTTQHYLRERQGEPQ
ncbi:MAG: CMP-N-acetylneuraminic acid synthetase [Halioglobus sp.]|jgi:CMP-N-acetylneuraminic acid synthetase